MIFMVFLFATAILVLFVDGSLKSIVFGDDALVEDEVDWNEDVIHLPQRCLSIHELSQISFRFHLLEQGDPSGYPVSDIRYLRLA